MNTTSLPPSAPAESLRRPLFLWSLPFTFLYFGLPIISKEFGASAVEIGGLFAVFTGTTLVLRPAAGWLIDRFGRKPFFVMSLFFYAAAMIVFALASSMSWLYFARLIQGVGSAFLWTAAHTIVADLTSPAERGRALGQLSAITTRGGLVGVFAAYFAMSVLPDGAGWTISFIGFAILTFASAVLAWTGVPDAKPVRMPYGQKSALSRQLIKLLVIVFITGVPEAMLAPIYLTYLQDKFTTEIELLAWAFFPAGLVSAFLATRLGGFSDRFGRVPALALGLAGAGLLSLLMPGLPSIAWLALIYALSTVLWGISEPAETALVADLTGHEQRGFGYGLYDFVENLGFTVGPLLGGMLYDRIGMDTPFYLNGVVLIISAVLVITFLRELPLKKSA